jgi:iron complex transport system ATP-binding protein
MKGSAPVLETENLSIGYKSKKVNALIAANLNVSLLHGQLVCLLGANGSGKSTLMRTLAGLQPVLAGKILLNRKEISELKSLDLARQLSLVLTERLETGNLTAREVISLGRTPHTGWFGRLTEKDEQQIDQAIAFTDTESLLNRHMNQLSDGERQKVMLARALAQDTNLILLDEPTAHLDLPNRIELMKLLHQLAAETNKAILISTHELDLALQTADRLWLMKKGGELVTGVPEDLILNGSFESVFNKKGFYFDTLSGTFAIQRVPGLKQVFIEGDEKYVFWTAKALQRAGFDVSKNENASCKILISAGKNGELSWKVTRSTQFREVHSIESVVHFLAAE